MENIKMSETAEKTTGKVNEEVRSVADRFKEAMTVDSKTGVGAGTENAYVAERDARGLTHETVLSVKQFERVVADASTLADRQAQRQPAAGSARRRRAAAGAGAGAHGAGARGRAGRQHHARAHRDHGARRGDGRAPAPAAGRGTVADAAV